MSEQVVDSRLLGLEWLGLECVDQGIESAHQACPCTLGLGVGGHLIVQSLAFAADY